VRACVRACVFVQLNISVTDNTIHSHSARFNNIALRHLSCMYKYLLRFDDILKQTNSKYRAICEIVKLNKII